MTHIPFLPTAEEEFLRQVASYEGERPGLGADSLEEVNRATRRIASFPRHRSP